MLGLAITFAILALVAGILGFVALAGSSRDDRQGSAVRFPGPLRDLADLWQEVGAGCLIFVGVGKLIVGLPGHQSFVASGERNP